ncbi:uncharacterized protein CG45078-like isoform X4 [Sitodiplosis mosellana]|uniref:uncharacterized protein CG45078-like isoform X4 n=1 Tax=Sitodiplosis mosellana TaxID=263140 RepID=UPI0024440F65|nr:uncharacterized protein CG45078-like isoform X4 [Sitodiplosis mosellana]
MVYESDFYTTRRPYSSRPNVSSYSVTRRDVDWEKTPFVPRPSLIADPITAFGKRKPRNEEKVSILERINREGIKPNQEILDRPIHPYISARDATRNRVLSEVRRSADIREGGGSAALITDKFSMDKVLPRLHNKSQNATKDPHRQVFFYEPSKYNHK